MKILGELQAQVWALVRRGKVIRTPLLQVGELRLNPSYCFVNYSEKLLLTSKKYILLELFLWKPSQVFTRGQIIEHLSEVLPILWQQVFTAANGSRFQVSFCFGLAEYPPDGLTLQSLYQVVSILLYKP